jgi:spermidine/putrescine transport system ATP-binding protein
MSLPDDLPSNAPAISIVGVSKRFGAVEAVRGLSLEIRDGEFFSLLGPSGCGKTTLMRMLAGFETPDEGRIVIRGEDVTNRPPNRRPTNMVFQSYELFPHLSVADNVAYGLKLRKVPAAERGRRVGEMLELVGVAGLERRRANELSGGQQQRVALARALVNRPAVLLLDEPLSALDVKLRKRMQLELKAIQAELRTTFVFVTHDQEEALVLSDRIGIMSAGELLQVATPRELYERPADPFVADFVGTLSELRVTVAEVEGDLAIATPALGQRVALVAPGAAAGDTLRIGVRPERVRIGPRGVTDGESRVDGTVVSVIFLGSVVQHVVDVPELGRIVCQGLSEPGTSRFAAAEAVTLSWDAGASITLESATQAPDAFPEHA